MDRAHIVLALESSCDDTSAAIIIDGHVHANVVDSQDVHKAYGGVVPELASREHLSRIIPVVDRALKKAEISKRELSAIAFTRGPGLLGSLIVGVNFSKSLSLALGIPMISVNHMEAHVMAHFAEQPHPSFPFLCLTVSGGHTQIVKLTDYNEMQILGETKDDAAGEAFDKSGKILGLPYPAGPVIDKLAKTGKPIYSFSTSTMPDFDYSFSGLKTSILYFLKRELKKDPKFIENNLPDICASIQHTIVTYLLSIFEKAAKKEGITQLGIAGGVSANSLLRSSFTTMCAKNNWRSFIPKLQYCTDNAGMIGISGYYKLLKEDFVQQDVFPDARLRF